MTIEQIKQAVQKRMNEKGIKTHHFKDSKIVSESQLHRWFRNESKLTDEKLIALLDYLGLDLKI